VIGRRRLDTHFLALEQLGARYTLTDVIAMEAQALRGADVFLDEPSVTGTENAMAAAVLAQGTTILRNAASEPHVQDLAHFLVALGAKIEGIGTNQLTSTAARRSAAPRTASARTTSRSARSSGWRPVTRSELRSSRPASSTCARR
jgi:UDP-N-acetylglucosamine 1-carboxyvinyltransferase